MIIDKCESCGSDNVVVQGGNCTTCRDCGMSSCAIAWKYLAFIDYKVYDFCRSCQLRVKKELKLNRCLKCNRLLHKKPRTETTRRSKRDLLRKQRQKQQLARV